MDESGEELIDYGSAAQFVEPTVSGRNIGIKIRNITKVCICAYLHVLCFLVYASKINGSSPIK